MRGLAIAMHEEQDLAMKRRSWVVWQVDVDYTERSVSISSFPLSAAVTAVKLASACEKKWGVDPVTN